MSVSHFGTLGSMPRGRTGCTRALGAGEAIQLIVGTLFYPLSVSVETHSGMETMMAASHDRGGWKPHRCSSEIISSTVWWKQVTSQRQQPGICKL